MDPVELLKDLIRFPSLSGKERDIADYLEQAVGATGIDVSRHEDNVIFSIGDGPRCLLLNSHLDVVPPSENHPFEPFEPVENGGRLFGRGSVDAKASVAAMTTAAVRLFEAGWTRRGRLVVALTTCEESGGGYNGMEAVRSVLPPLSAALVGEPTHMQPCIAQKGLLILTGIAQGRSAHAARAKLGDNAIEKAARDVGRIAEASFDKADPYLGYPTVAVTTIEGGKARNVVPDECRFTMDIRSTPQYSHAELTGLFASMLESEVRVYSERIVPVSTRPDEPIVRACLAAHPDAAPFGSPTASDWIFLHDVPTVKIGPGDSRLSHTAQESILISEVRAAAEHYQRIVTTFFDLLL